MKIISSSSENRVRDRFVRTQIIALNPLDNLDTGIRYQKISERKRIREDGAKPVNVSKRTTLHIGEQSYNGTENAPSKVS